MDPQIPILTMALSKMMTLVGKPVQDHEKNDEHWWTWLKSNGKYSDAWWDVIDRLSKQDRRCILQQLKEEWSANLGEAVLQCKACDYICIGMHRMRTHMSSWHYYGESTFSDLIIVLEKGRSFTVCDKCCPVKSSSAA
jgi:hypothetical protein